MLRSALAALALLVCPRSSLEPTPLWLSELSVQARRSPPKFCLASYYHSGLHGRLTASGLRYNEQALTVASPSLPFGTWLRLRRGSLEVLVQVTDRGPFVPGRELDLSRAAAHRLGMLQVGLAFVQVEVL